MKKLIITLMVFGLLMTQLALAASQKEKQVTVHAAVRNYTMDYDEPWHTGKEGFEKLHPDVKVQLEGLDYDEQREKMLIAVSAGKGPDITYLDCIWLGEFAANNIVITVTDRFNATPAFKNDLFQPYIDGATWQGEIYGPWSHTDLRTLIWNKEHFRAAGLDPERPPKTWTELRQFAKQLTRPAEDIWGVGYPAFALEGSIDVWYPFLLQGGRILSKDFTKAEFHGPHGVAALQLYYDLMHVDKAAPEDLLGVEEGDHQDALLAGKYSMIWQSGSSIGDSGLSVDQYEAKFGSAAYPLGPGGTKTTSSGGWVIGITRDSKNPDMAWEFLKDALRSENLLKFVIKEGAVPTYKSVMNHPEFAASMVHYETLMELIDLTNFRPPIPEYLKVADEIVDAMQRVLTKDASPQEAMAEAGKAADAILAQRKW
jgi:multiple sugar transport system substrate-binding protein